MAERVMDHLDVELPRATAGPYMLPDGTEVWVQTLGSLSRDEAVSRSHRYAQRECASILPGGEDREILLSPLRGMTPDEQASLLAGHAFRSGEIRQEVDAKFPEVPEPERQDGQSDEAWSKAMEEWRAACEKRVVARKAHQERLWEKERKDALALKPKTRLDRCATAEFAKEFGRAFGRQYMVEMLFRAVRRVDQHSHRYFSCTQEIEDLDEETLGGLMARYDELDGVQPEAVPS